VEEVAEVVAAEEAVVVVMTMGRKETTDTTETDTQ